METLEQITEGLEGLTELEKAELATKISRVVTETKTQFLEGKKAFALQQRYNTELEKMNLNGVSSMQRVRMLNELKAKYRAQGLKVW